MIVPRGIIIPLGLLVTILTATISFTIGIGEAPTAFFGSGDVVIIGPPAGAIPGRGQVSATLVDPLRSLPYVRIVSPEIYAITTLDGKSLFVRGVDPASFFALEGAHLLDGRLPTAPGEAIGGAGCLSQLGLRVGDTILVPSSFARIVVPFRIVGSFEASGPARDEILTTLEGARELTPLSPTDAHIIRISTTLPENLSSLVGSVAPTFTYSDARLSATDIAPGEPVTMTAQLTNWGIMGGTKLVQVKSNGNTIAERPYFVGSRATIPVQLSFVLSETGEFNITINPTFHVTVKRPALKFFDTPNVGVIGTSFVARLSDPSGVPVAGAEIALGSDRSITDENGTALLTPKAEGKTSVVGYQNGSVEAILRIYVAPAEYANVSFAGVDVLSPPVEVIGANASSSFTVEFHNRGAIAGPTLVNLTVDGKDAGSISAFLQPGETTQQHVTVEPMGAGTHTIRTIPSGPTIIVKAYSGRDPRVEALLEAFEGHANDPSSTPSMPEDAQRYVDALLGNVRVAVIALSIASGALVAMGSIAVLSRHLAERAPSVGALKALGASDEHVLGVVVRESAMFGAIATLCGVVSGIVLAALLDATGFVRAFGHAVHPALAGNTIALVILLSIAFIVLTARALVSGALRHP
ncbi:MAG: FtsX-like permease family protein, partial [Candidatus Thermoplasmatota archaeon]